MSQNLAPTHAIPPAQPRPGPPPPGRWSVDLVGHGNHDRTDHRPTPLRRLSVVREHDEGVDDLPFRCAYPGCGREGDVLRDLAIVDAGGAVFCRQRCLDADELDRATRMDHGEADDTGPARPLGVVAGVEVDPPCRPVVPSLSAVPSPR